MRLLLEGSGVVRMITAAFRSRIHEADVELYNSYAFKRFERTDEHVVK